MTWFFNIFWADEGLEGFPFLDRLLFGAVCLIIFLAVFLIAPIVNKALRSDEIK